MKRNLVAESINAQVTMKYQYHSREREREGGRLI